MTDAEIRERSTLTLLKIIIRQEDEIESLRRSKSNGAAVIQSWMDGTWADINAMRSPSMSKESAMLLQRVLEVVERNGGMDPAEREADAVSAEHIHKKWNKSP